MNYKSAIIVLLLFVSAGSAFAQQYPASLGIRLGLYNGVTYKKGLSDKHSLEGIFTTRFSGFNLTGLYQFNYYPFDVEGFYWYWGVGGHVGYYSNNSAPWITEASGGVVAGLDAIVALEYVFAEIPLAVTLDYKPTFNVIGGGFIGDGGALSVRYIF